MSLRISGTMHFIVDVVSQFIRDERPPGLETTLYYGLHSAFSLGQVALGLTELFLTRGAMSLLSDLPLLIVSLAAAFGWLSISFRFMEYWEPKFAVAIFAGLIIAALVTRSRPESVGVFSRAPQQP